jgi:hypothetical protein
VRKELLLLAICALALAGAVAPAADSTATRHPKASSLAPQHTGSRVYGAPIQPPILHKRHKPKHTPGVARDKAAQPPGAPAR